MIESKIWSVILHRSKLDKYKLDIGGNPIQYTYVVDNVENDGGNDGDITVNWKHLSRGFVGRVNLRMSIHSMTDVMLPKQSILTVSCNGIHPAFTMNDSEYEGGDTLEKERAMVPDMLNFTERVIEERVTENVESLLSRMNTVSPPTAHDVYGGYVSTPNITGELHIGTPEIETEVINTPKTNIFTSIKDKLETEMDKWCGGTIDKLRSEYMVH